jgi:DNA-binding NarL/FixJ family response regulator
VSQQEASRIPKVRIDMVPIRVVLADDHPVIRDIFRRILRNASDIQIVGEAADGNQAFHLVKEMKPDVVLLDVEMPGLNGLEVMKRMRTAGIATPVLMISAHNDYHYILSLFQAGIAGYLCKDELGEDLVAAVHSVFNGNYGFLSQRLAASFVIVAFQEGLLGDFTLGDAEQKILRLASQGKSAQDISRSLGLSQAFVRQKLRLVEHATRRQLARNTIRY